MQPFYKTILLLFLHSPFFIFNSFSQQAPGIEWAKCYGGSSDEGASSIQQTNDNGYIVVGSTGSNDGDVTGNHGNYDYWIIKLDSMGTLQWQKCFGGTAEDIAYSVIQTFDYGYVIGGYTKSNDGDVSNNHDTTGNISDFWLIKLDSIGSLIWQKCLGGSSYDKAYIVYQTADSGLIVSGNSYSDDFQVSGNHGSSDYWILKLDLNGNLQWQKCFGGNDAEVGGFIDNFNGSGNIIGGHSWSADTNVSGNHGDADYWMLKIDSTMNIQWEKCFGGSLSEYCRSLHYTNTNEIIAAGDTHSNNGDVSGNHSLNADGWIIKLDTMGNLIWQKCFGGMNSDVLYSIEQTTDSGFVSTGQTNSIDGDVNGNHGLSDCWVIRLDNSNNLLWQKCLGGSTNDYGYSTQQTIDNGYIIAGETLSNNGDVSGNHGSYDYWIIKLAPDTITSVPNFQIPSASGGFQIFPNPSSGIFQITFPSSSNQKTNYTLEVINTLAQTVFTSPLTPLQRRGESTTLPIDLSFLPKGIYVLKTNDAENSFSKKITIQ